MTKLRPPAIRRAMLTRAELLTRIDRCGDRRLLLVACPAGFGKTTLLASWSAARSAAEPVGWVTLDEGDNDPMVLWAHIIEALRRICPAIGDTVALEAAGSAALTDTVLPRLVNALTDQPPVSLVLDDYHRLTGRASRGSVAWFLEHVPAGFHLVIATRSEPRLPLGVLRARGELCEFRSEDLRFTVEEAEVLLNDRLGLELDPADVRSLVERTEGWPAGLYLAALSLEGAHNRHEFVQRFGASNRHVVDLLVDEVLDLHDPDMQELMTRASILERINGPLCDAVLQAPGGAARLAELARTNLFLVPLDDQGEWYRFHHLFGQLLRVQLERREPGVAPTLHRRASAWHRDHGGTPEAITHAISAGDYDEATELIAGVWLEFTNACRYETVRGWLHLFPDEVRQASARLLLVNAWVSSMCADRVDAARCIGLIEDLGTTHDGPLPEGFRSVESSLTVLKAVAAWGDVGAQVENGRRAAILEPPGTPWHPVACWAVGVGSYLGGEFDEADRWFDTAAQAAPGAGQWLTAASALAYQSLVAGELHRPQHQQTLAERAVDMTERLGLGGVVGEADVALG
ncbi:MAG TPA: helix-turn-helix transcriptional regulator, partial [Mycobacterium sp.]